MRMHECLIIDYQCIPDIGLSVSFNQMNPIQQLEHLIPNESAPRQRHRPSQDIFDNWSGIVLNAKNYDTQKCSRIKAETRQSVEESS